MPQPIKHGSDPDKVLFSTAIATRWSDMDADSRINNLIILRYTEEARMQWAASLGLQEIAPDLMPVVAAIEGQFHLAISYPSVLTVEISCFHLGTSSLQLRFRIIDAQLSSSHYATAIATWVWVDKSTNKPTPMPRKLRDICNGDVTQRHPDN